MVYCGIQEQLREFFGDLVFRTVIHRDPILLEAPGAGHSVLTYSPEGRSATEYKALTKEISDGKTQKKRVKCRCFVDF